MDLSNLRQDYKMASLDEHEVAASPFTQFEQWFKQAQAAKLTEPNAMTLASVDATGQAQARIVLLKAFDERGFGFFTNYESKKGQALRTNPKAALLFYWAELERQVRIEGEIVRMSAAESDDYFHSRPLGSRIGAWASPQSQVLSHRTQLETAFAAIAEQFGEHPPRPPHWGGYRLSPQYMEFWQGRSSRLHDRVAYQLTAGKWQISRLAP